MFHSVSSSRITLGIYFSSCYLTTCFHYPLSKTIVTLSFQTLIRAPIEQGTSQIQPRISSKLNTYIKHLGRRNGYYSPWSKLSKSDNKRLQ